MQLICILGCRTWPVCRYHSQTFHDSCRADRSSCFKPLGLWDHPSCSGNNWYCLDLFFFFLPVHSIAWPVTIVFLCSVCERSLVLEGGQRNVVHVVLQLICQACLSWQALWICTALKFITPTYRETNKQPNLRLPEPQLQQAVALLTFTAQCFSYPSSSPRFFFFFFPCSRVFKPTTF